MWELPSINKGDNFIRQTISLRNDSLTVAEGDFLLHYISTDKEVSMRGFQNRGMYIYEEGVSQSFQKRLERFRMNEVQGRFRIAANDTVDELIARLKNAKSPKFVIVDSFQASGFTYEDTKTLRRLFPRKCFIFISWEDKGQPFGKPARKLKYDAGVKVRVSGYKAYCQGRFIPEAGAYYPVWLEGILKTTNNLE